MDKSVKNARYIVISSFLLSGIRVGFISGATKLSPRSAIVPWLSAGSVLGGASGDQSQRDALGGCAVGAGRLPADRTGQ